MPSGKRKFGDIGEKIAFEYLTNNGFRIIEKNYLKKFAEIDIIAKKDNFLVFFEVKTRQKLSRENFLPEQNVDARKQRKLSKICELYLLERKFPAEQDWRIDVLAVLIDKFTGGASINHIEDAVWGSRY